MQFIWDNLPSLLGGGGGGIRMMSCHIVNYLSFLAGKI